MNWIRLRQAQESLFVIDNYARRPGQSDAEIARVDAAIAPLIELRTQILQEERALEVQRRERQQAEEAWQRKAATEQREREIAETATKMNPMQIIAEIEKAGARLSLDDDAIIVSPQGGLDYIGRIRINARRSDIIAALKSRETTERI